MPVSEYWKISKYFTNDYDFVDYNYRIMRNYNPSSDFDTSTMGLSYHGKRCEAQTSIVYWAFYKGQQPCFLNLGKHEGDWERIIVDVTPDFSTIKKVVIFQYGGHYTRYPNTINVDYSDGGAHVRTYTGKNSNGQYHDSGGIGGCLYFDDFRNVGNSGKYWNSWKDGKLEKAHTNNPYNNYEGSWGRDGIKGPATRKGGYFSRSDCKSSGCKKNQEYIKRGNSLIRTKVK